MSEIGMKKCSFAYIVNRNIPYMPLSASQDVWMRAFLFSPLSSQTDLCAFTITFKQINSQCLRFLK
jgi:hypothetical protein